MSFPGKAGMYNGETGKIDPRHRDFFDQLNAIRSLEEKNYPSLTRKASKKHNLNIKKVKVNHVARGTINLDFSKRRTTSAFKAPSARGLLQPLERWHTYLKQGLCSYYARPRSGPQSSPSSEFCKYDQTEAIELSYNESQKGLAEDQEKTEFVDELTTHSVQKWRPKILEWVYKVLDYFSVDREIAFICISYVDRFVAVMLTNLDHELVRSGSTTCALEGMPIPFTLSWYQCVAISCLALASKVHAESDPRDILPLRTLLDLSQKGTLAFDIWHVVEMETRVLFALKWHVHPPTSCSTVSILIRILPWVLYSRKRKNVREEVVQLAYFLTELSVLKQEVVSAFDASTMGLAALWVALCAYEIPSETCEGFLFYVVSNVCFDMESDELDRACDAFEDLFEMNKRDEEKLRASSACIEETQTGIGDVVSRSLNQSIVSPKVVTMVNSPGPVDTGV